MKDTLYTGEEVRERLARGIEKAAAAVGITMGTGGGNSIIEAIENPGHFVTNDGATILQAIHFEDPIEEIGKNILLEAVSRANKQSGDGSSTTTVLTAAIIREGRKYLKDFSPMEIKRSLEACIPLIEESINKQKKDVTVDEIGAVAAISAEDESVGKLIQEIYQQIGKEGIIHWDISKTSEDSYSIGSGITVDGATYASPYMCDADEAGRNTNQIRLKNPKVLITKQKLTSASEFNDLFSALFAKEIRDIVVFCDEYEPLMVNDLILTRAKRGFRTILVKMPVLWKDQWFEDLALASGAKLVDPAAGFTLKQVKLEDLGTFGNIIVTKHETFIDGIQDLSLHVKQLEEEATEESLYRASRLNTKTARLFLGAHSESALAYKRLKVEDAISAAYQALHGGVVAGGGVALLKAGRELINRSSFSVLGHPHSLIEGGVGVDILLEALREPLRQIAKNANYCEESFFNVDRHLLFFKWKERVSTLKIEGLGGTNGLDTKTGKIVDMFEAGITDPAPVVLNAAKNAISVAAAVLTASTLVTLPREQQQMPNLPVQV